MHHGKVMTNSDKKENLQIFHSAHNTSPINYNSKISIAMHYTEVNLIKYRISGSTRVRKEEGRRIRGNEGIV
jgi:hypothetical protein